MDVFDVAIVGGGPAGSTCAAFCAAAGLKTLLLEREKFPREKVCGDSLNPACWPVFRRLQLEQRVRNLPHGKLEAVEFITLGGRRIHVDLPRGEDGEIAVKRSLLDSLLLRRARELGAEVFEKSVVMELGGAGSRIWKIDIVAQRFGARFLIAADGRNSTVARLCGLLPGAQRERVALQAHIALPPNFGNRVVLQFLPEGYSGQAPVNENELDLCLVGTPPKISSLRNWAERHFNVALNQPWRTVTPLTRSPVSAAHKNLLFIGDAARVVEPFTGEGIYYALRSGELAAQTVSKVLRGGNGDSAIREFARAHAAMYRGRLWINRLSRAAVLSPAMGSLFFQVARFQPGALRFLTGRITRRSPRVAGTL
jgi:menaquinone-9 beta-reductase